MLHVIEHTLLDTIKLVPFLFITYLAMEFLEHKAGEKTLRFVKKSGNFGPVIGSLFGALPQCGFSAAAANFYAGRVITMGTLIAIFLSTSDEMLPILIAQSVDVTVIAKILAMKIVIGMAAGFLIDFIFPAKKQEHSHDHIHEMCEHDHCNCQQGGSIWKSSLKHTLQITFFLLLITFALNAVLEFVGEDVLASLILNKPILGPVLASVVGLIPNCASSVVLTTLYLEGALSFGAMMAGLLVNSGVGVLVLLKSNTDRKEDINIIGCLFVIGVVVGIIIETLHITM